MIALWVGLYATNPCICLVVFKYAWA
jgi:hypothetical protein